MLFKYDRVWNWLMKNAIYTVASEGPSGISPGIARCTIQDFRVHLPVLDLDSSLLISSSSFHMVECQITSSMDENLAVVLQSTAVLDGTDGFRHDAMVRILQSAPFWAASVASSVYLQKQLSSQGNFRQTLCGFAILQIVSCAHLAVTIESFHFWPPECE